MAAIKALEQWCKLQCDGYRDVAITNMTTSFRSGLAFCALIHKYRPDLIDYDMLKKEDVFGNNHLAFQVAEEKLGIPALLDAEDMVALKVPDRLSILTYVSQYYNYFNGRCPIGGVKRPAEGSKEEPSEKKNLPVVAKTFVSKTANEKCLPPTLIAETSPKLARAAVQKTVLAEKANNTGTLSNKCVECKCHVHLVQRHFVEGKLYHRSCFKCSECSGVLHVGAYKPGKEPHTFICNAHQKTQNNGKPPSTVAVIKTQNNCKPPSTGAVIKTQNNCKPPSTGAVIKNVPSLAVGSKSDSQPHPASHSSSSSSSALSAPVTVVGKPRDPPPPPKSWTVSAQRTQVARQKFFQSAAPKAAEGHGDRKPPEPSDLGGRSRVAPPAPEEKGQARAIICKKLAEENCNNNNARRFVIRSAERRFGEVPDAADKPNLNQTKPSEGPAGNKTAQVSTTRTNSQDLPCLKASGKDATRSTTGYVSAKDSIRNTRWPELKPSKPELMLRHTDSEDGPVCTKRHKPEAISKPSSDVTVTTTSPVAQLPETSPVSSPQYDPAWLTDLSVQKPRHSSGNMGMNRGSNSPVKSPTSGLVLECPNSSLTVPVHCCDSLTSDATGSKKGKYLSPTNASRPEMGSHSVRSHHIPVEQIEKELDNIETNLSILEKEGVKMEEQLRRCENEGEGDILMDPLMVDWFNLIRKKQMYIRRESELVYIAKTQDLEQQQPSVEGQLRSLLEKPEHLKSIEDQRQESRLMERLVGIVNSRNAIVEGLDEDRRREEEEDQLLNEMLQNLGVRTSKKKRKSSIKNLFRRRSKKAVGD